eukprot:scaffold84002_cov42-Prasinocladus_malaysianus.AAC.3
MIFISPCPRAKVIAVPGESRRAKRFPVTFSLTGCGNLAITVWLFSALPAMQKLCCKLWREVDQVARRQDPSASVTANLLLTKQSISESGDGLHPKARLEYAILELPEAARFREVGSMLVNIAVNMKALYEAHIQENESCLAVSSALNSLLFLIFISSSLLWKSGLQSCHWKRDVAQIAFVFSATLMLSDKVDACFESTQTSSRATTMKLLGFTVICPVHPRYLVYTLPVHILQMALHHLVPRASCLVSPFEPVSQADFWGRLIMHICLPGIVAASIFYTTSYMITQRNLLRALSNRPSSVAFVR